MVRKIAMVVVGLAIGVSFGSSPAVVAQTVVQSSYVCPQCGRVHASQHASTPPAFGGTVIQSTPSYTSVPVMQASPVVQTSAVQYSGVPQQVQPAVSYSSAPSYSSGGTSNVLAMLNSQRARRGIPALSFDPTLQAVAERRAQQMASMRLKNHPPGSFAPGRKEGVGWSSSYSPSGVSACFTSDTNLRAAGAAMATGPDGVYFSVVYR